MILDEEIKRRFPYLNTLSEIKEMSFPEQEWLIEPILPIGSTILAGPPKIGKSYFILDRIKEISDQGKEVVYYALEDGCRRLQARINQLGLTIDNVIFAAGREADIGSNGTTFFDDVNELLELRPSIKAVFIDTMTLALPRRAKARDYDDAVHDLKPWSDLAYNKNISILMVHHTRKSNGLPNHNPYDEILGSQGIIGSFDTVMIMRGKETTDSKAAVLNISGKDVEEQEYRLSKKDYGWSIEGLESIASLGSTQEKVYSFIKTNDGCLTKTIQETIRIDKGQLSKTLRKLTANNLIEKKNDYYFATK